jgi:hypothetical protein
VKEIRRFPSHWWSICRQRIFWFDLTVNSRSAPCSRHHRGCSVVPSGLPSRWIHGCRRPSAPERRRAQKAYSLTWATKRCLPSQTSWSRPPSPPGIWLIIQACSTSPNCCNWALL